MIPLWKRGRTVTPPTCSAAASRGDRPKLTPCRPYRRGPLAEVPRNTRKYTQGRPLLKRPAKESKRQQKSLRARSSSFFKQKVYARALKQGPADTEKVNYRLRSDWLIISCPCVTPSRISFSSVQPGRLSLLGVTYSKKSCAVGNPRGWRALRNI